MQDWKRRRHIHAADAAVSRAGPAKEKHCRIKRFQALRAKRVNSLELNNDSANATAAEFATAL